MIIINVKFWRKKYIWLVYILTYGPISFFFMKLLQWKIFLFGRALVLDLRSYHIQQFNYVFLLKILMFKSFVQLTLPFHPHNKNYNCWSDLYYISSGRFHVNHIVFRIGSTKCILNYHIVKYVGLQCHILKAYFIFIYIYQKIVKRNMNNSGIMRNDLF